MRPRVTCYSLVVVTIVGTVIGYGPSAFASDTVRPAASIPGATLSNGWTANGATACEKFLTPAVVGAILTLPAGHSKPMGANGCEFRSDSRVPGSSSLGGGTYAVIRIGLFIKEVAAFRQELPRLSDVNPLKGVGDVAYWTPREEEEVDAAKAPDHECVISVDPTPAATRVDGAALADKLGAICTQLFALR